MTPGRLTTALLVVAVLVCHGLFGAAHQTFTPATGAHVHHASPHKQASAFGEAQGGDHTGHQTGHHEAGHLAGSADYAAVLVTILFGAVLRLLRGILLLNAAPALQSAGRSFRNAIARIHHLRRPALPALQVFRL